MLFSMTKIINFITCITFYIKKNEKMKKIITLSLLALTLVFSAQNMTAQNTLEINAEANAKTKELRKIIKFDESKMDDVYKVYQNYGVAYKKIGNNLEVNADRLKKIDTYLDSKLEEILTEEQYISYLKYFRDRTR
jgi:hypothetical protein